MVCSTLSCDFSVMPSRAFAFAFYFSALFNCIELVDVAVPAVYGRAGSLRFSRGEDGVRDDGLHREQLQVLGRTPGG